MTSERQATFFPFLSLCVGQAAQWPQCSSLVQAREGTTFFPVKVHFFFFNFEGLNVEIKS